MELVRVDERQQEPVGDKAKEPFVAGARNLQSEIFGSAAAAGSAAAGAAAGMHIDDRQPSPQPSKQCFTESSCGSDGCGAQLDPTMRPATAC